MRDFEHAIIIGVFKNSVKMIRFNEFDFNRNLK